MFKKFLPLLIVGISLFTVSYESKATDNNPSSSEERPFILHQRVQHSSTIGSYIYTIISDGTPRESINGFVYPLPLYCEIRPKLKMGRRTRRNFIENDTSIEKTNTYGFYLLGLDLDNRKCIVSYRSRNNDVCHLHLTWVWDIRESFTQGRWAVTMIESGGYNLPEAPCLIRTSNTSDSSPDTL